MASRWRFVGWLIACLTSLQHGRVSNNCTCSHTETEVADQTFYLARPQFTDTRPTSPSADPVKPGVRQCSHWVRVPMFKSLVCLDLEKSPRRKRESNPESSALEAGALTPVCFVCWLLIVPATCQCISGTDLLRQFDVLPD